MILSSDRPQDGKAVKPKAVFVVKPLSAWDLPFVILFLHRFNSNYNHYVSACLDPAAVVVDAFLCRWPQEVCSGFHLLLCCNKCA